MNRTAQQKVAEVVPEDLGPVRLGWDHFGLTVYEKQGQLWAVGTGAEIDRAVALFVEQEMTSFSIQELLGRYQPMVDPMAVLQAYPIDVVDTLLERLIRWAVKRDPGRYLGSVRAANKPRIAVVEGLPSSFAIRLD